MKNNGPQEPKTTPPPNYDELKDLVSEIENNGKVVNGLVVSEEGFGGREISYTWLLFGLIPILVINILIIFCE